MDNSLTTAIDVSASGMRAQTKRIKVIAENLANAESGPTVKSGEPYRRKTIAFKSVLDRASGATKVDVANVGKDNAPFRMKYDPANPMADEKGYIQMPNVNSLIELSDMREAQRSYEANISMIETSRNMIRSTLDLLR